MDRAYTLSEIDGMRETLKKRFHEPNELRIIYGNSEYGQRMRLLQLQTDSLRHTQIEEELRTCMLAGVDPAEFTL